MNELFSSHAPRRSSFIGTALSVLLHGALIGGGLAVVQITTSMPRMVAPRTLFVFPLAMPQDLRTHYVPVHVTPAAVANPRLPEQRIAVPEVLTPKRDEPRAEIDPASIRPATAHAPNTTPALVEPRSRPVVVGAFESGVTKTGAVQAVRDVRAAGFDTAAARAPELKIRAAAVGAFETAASVVAHRPGFDQPAQQVAVGGFGGSGIAAPTSRPDRAVVNAGFGNGQIGARAPTPVPVQVRAAGFDTQAAAPSSPSKEVPLAARIEIPVEVIFKPVPDYTDEARALKIEGEVVLEVQFTADGQVRVIRTVRGLGHGLDEAAVRAAERIRFKPAQSGGRPADFRTTVHIVFRLT